VKAFHLPGLPSADKSLGINSQQHQLPSNRSTQEKNPMQKSRIRLIAVSLALLLLPTTVQIYLPPACANQTPQHAATPEEVVRQFYRWYLPAGYPQPEKKNLAEFRKYITQKFLRQAMDPDVDANLFIDAQDTDPTWMKGVFSVSKATIRGQKATVLLTLKGEEQDYKLRVLLRRDNGSWKIDDVHGLTYKTVGS
jgi:hypothetical protein